MPEPAGGFLAAVQFLTRIPVRLRRAPDLAAAVVWFPVVGALVGGVAGVIVAGLEDFIAPSAAAALGVLAGVLITGAFHEDGLADFADAVAGGSTPERRLEILQDPRHGTYGVAALAGSIVLRILCVAALAPSPAPALAGLVAAHSLGRGAAVAVMGWAPLARSDGLGAAYTTRVGPAQAAIGGAVAVALAALATGWWAVPLTVAAALSAVVIVALARRSLGGITGDVLGAIEQVAECAVLVGVTAFARRYELWWR
ncbi:MAG: adenosylcobinamide-GDP ribazoletransferase [Ilumatobacteraceae bacterium]